VVEAGDAGAARHPMVAPLGPDFSQIGSPGIAGDLGVVFGDPQRQRGSSLKVALYRPLPAVVLAAPDTAGGR
jgi:hypothetical protein